jgi:putative SOS response-associated peptidase YedK
MEVAEGRARQELHDHHVPAEQGRWCAHDRMPVVLAPDAWSTWLGEQGATPDELKTLLVPCPDEVLRIWPVDRAKIGSVRNKERDVADPVALPA